MSGPRTDQTPGPSLGLRGVPHTRGSRRAHSKLQSCRPRPCGVETHRGRHGPEGASRLRENHTRIRPGVSVAADSSSAQSIRGSAQRTGRDVTRVHGVYHRLGFGAAFAVAAQHCGVRDEILLRRDDGEGRRLLSRKSGLWLKALDVRPIAVAMVSRRICGRWVHSASYSQSLYKIYLTTYL